MRPLSLFVWALCTSRVGRASPIREPDLEATAANRILDLQTQYQHNVLTQIGQRRSGCTTQTIRRRKEWSALPRSTRASFISAIHCLNTLPPQTPSHKAPGARTRYDDFIVTHIEQTPLAHASGLFLPFHRHLLHALERTLRETCGYTHALPYWDWTAAFEDPRRAEVFDGSETSMGGNGRWVAGRNATEIVLPDGVVKKIPPATGGGCVESGPFAEGRYFVRLGPVGYEPKGPMGGLGYNPRCLTRDLSPEFSQGTRPSAVTALVDGCENLGCFVQELDAPGGVPGGLHASGHWQIGLTALDVFASPGDPMFWLHHAQVDRVWTIWQGQDLEKRTYEVWGTGTAANIPPSDNVALDTAMDFGTVDTPKTIREVSSPVDGDYCYMYE